jgi:hypothetical protein
MEEMIEYEEDMSDLMNPHYINHSDFINQNDNNNNRELFELIEKQQLHLSELKYSMKADAASFQSVISVKFEVTQINFRSYKA